MSSARPRRCGRDVLPAQTGVSYQPATLVLYDGATESGCGGAQAAMGPFYCPLDKKVYLDLSFFRDMETKYGGGGDFADAYVIAHEIGHHVQDLLGILAKTDAAKEGASQTQRNAISVRVELMADCLAGVWAANANQKWKLLDPGDVEKARGDGGGDRRRPPADGGARLRRARQLHPRLVGDAGQMADDRPQQRPGRCVRHVQAVGRALLPLAGKVSPARATDEGSRRQAR